MKLEGSGSFQLDVCPPRSVEVGMSLFSTPWMLVENVAMLCR